jgi:hypothetical protein
MATAELMVANSEAQMMESVLIGGDLSRMTPAMRVTYYKRVCESMGLNPLTKPFDYIQLNGKLTLYAKKDAADQLRRIHNVSIDDVDIQITDTHFVVKVKGHDRDGRADVEVGIVSKKDMQGNEANAQMKAVTKAKRRLTLSICGLGWLDETEVQTIPDARPVVVDDTGEIVEAGEESQAQPEQEASIEMVKPLGDKAVGYAAKAWNISQKEAAIEIGKKKLGPQIRWEDFVQIVNGQPS